MEQMEKLDEMQRKDVCEELNNEKFIGMEYDEDKEKKKDRYNTENKKK